MNMLGLGAQVIDDLELDLQPLHPAPQIYIQRPPTSLLAPGVGIIPSLPPALPPSSLCRYRTSITNQSFDYHHRHWKYI